MMHFEISEAGKHAAEQLLPLQAKEFGGCNKPHNDVAVTILKILTIIGGIFFAMLSATSLPPEMAFISITLIAIAVATLVTGAEKIIAIFPRGIWVWSGERHPPVVIRDSRPSHSRWTWYNPFTWGGGTSSRGGGHSVYTGRGGHSGGHSGHSRSDSYSGSSSTEFHSGVGSGHSGSSTTGFHSAVGGGHLGSPFVGGMPGNVAAGGGHDPSPIVGGTHNVGVGGGHDPRSTTPNGNVVPGSRR